MLYPSRATTVPSCTLPVLSRAWVPVTAHLSGTGVPAPRRENPGPCPQPGLHPPVPPSPTAMPPPAVFGSTWNSAAWPQGQHQERLFGAPAVQEELRGTMLTDGGVPQGTGLNTSPALAERSKSGCPAIMPRLFPQGSDGGADELLQRLATGWEQQGCAQRHTVRARLHSMGLMLWGCGGAGVGAWRQRPGYSNRALWVFGITIEQPKVLRWA